MMMSLAARSVLCTIGHVDQTGGSASLLQLGVYQNKCCSMTGGSGNPQICNLYDYGCNQTPQPHSDDVYYTCVFLDVLANSGSSRCGHDFIINTCEW